MNSAFKSRERFVSLHGPWLFWGLLLPLLYQPWPIKNRRALSFTRKKITSQKGFPFWPTHINSSPISLFRTASKMDFLNPIFVVRIHKLQNHPSMPMSIRQRSQGGATCKPQMVWVLFLFLRHMESTQLYKSESFVIMLQTMNSRIAFSTWHKRELL